MCLTNIGTYYVATSVPRELRPRSLIMLECTQRPRKAWLNSLFARRKTYGHLVGSRSCGIIVGCEILWESEGMVEMSLGKVDRGPVNSINLLRSFVSYIRRL